MGAGRAEPIGHTAAHNAALDFAGAAAARELVAHALYGDCVEVVSPADRPRYDATIALVQAERRAAVTLVRFSQSRGAWADVETALQMVVIRRDDLKARGGESRATELVTLLIQGGIRARPGEPAPPEIDARLKRRDLPSC